jgi:S-adenosylmethionine:tRNA ribosyltransferase-isomerase
MKTSDFDYQLPQRLIAQVPLEPRDCSRLMVLKRSDGSIEHRHFADLPGYLKAGDVLVFNDSRVIPARLKGKKAVSGGRVELLLLRQVDNAVWEVLLKPAKRVAIGARLEIGEADDNIAAEVVGEGEGGIKVIRFPEEMRLPRLGKIPLPPYIHTPLADAERYQTVYARVPGSVAAPTAGLHFTPRLLEQIKEKGVELLFVTLHVGLDTFRPVREEDPQQHPIHKEYGVVTEEVSERLNKARGEGRRIIGVGTTTVRIIEGAAQTSMVKPFEGGVGLFILPGYEFRLVDALITNFHLPCSTLLMLVAAFAGKDFIFDAYQEAIARKYRFYSFGDAMLIL